MIQFKQVSKQFGNTRALDQIDFDIAPGEFVFLTGPSGSGKTTLMRLMIGELKPDKGQIFIASQDITTFSRRKIPKLRQQIGVVFQDFKLLPDRTVYENIAVALRVRGFSGKSLHQKVVEVVEQVGIPHRLYVFPAQMAGGELQRACLARAIVAKPPILLADEPTGNLDPGTSWQIMQLIDQINKQGATILMATHNMDIVNSLNKRVLKIEHGQLVADVPQGKYEV